MRSYTIAALLGSIFATTFMTTTLGVPVPSGLGHGGGHIPPTSGFHHAPIAGSQQVPVASGQHAQLPPHDPLIHATTGYDTSNNPQVRT